MTLSFAWKIDYKHKVKKNWHSCHVYQHVILRLLKSDKILVLNLSTLRQNNHVFG